jgi:hypothetical protein
MSLRTEALANAIEEELNLDRVSDCGSEVFVSLKNPSSQPLSGMDDVCAIAYDHGFVPTGIIDTGAARFVPRDHDEIPV